MDFVFDRLADGRSLKCLTVVDDATHESVTITPDTAISGAYVARVLERVKHERGLPKVIRSDNGREFCGRAMAIWAHENNVALRFIEPEFARELRRKGIEYSLQRWTLNQAATKTGVTSQGCGAFYVCRGKYR